MRRLLATGCLLAATLTAPAQPVPAGSSPEVVLRSLGTPRSRSAARDREIWLYPDFQVVFQHGRMISLVALPADGGAIDWKTAPAPPARAAATPAAPGSAPVMLSREAGRTVVRSPERRPLAPAASGRPWLWLTVSLLAAGGVAVAWIRWRRRASAPPVDSSPAPAPVKTPAPVATPVTHFPAITGSAPSRKPPSLSEWELPPDLLRSLVPARFELLVERFYAVQGLKVKRNGSGVDGGVDLRLHRGGAARPFCYVQCRGWGAPCIEGPRVRALFDAMAANRVAEGALVTSGSFTEDARAFARSNRITVLSGEDLAERFNRLSPLDRARILREVTSGDYTTPVCPRCGVKLALPAGASEPTAPWTCQRYPRCTYTLPSLREAGGVT